MTAVKTSELNEGDACIARGFECLCEGKPTKVTIKRSSLSHSLYFDCDAGAHNIDGQIDIDDNGQTVYVGLEKIEDDK